MRMEMLPKKGIAVNRFQSVEALPDHNTTDFVTPPQRVNFDSRARELVRQPLFQTMC